MAVDELEVNMKFDKEERVKEILYQQLQLLAEKSKEEDIETDLLIRLSGEMDRMASTLLMDCSDD